MEKTYLETGKAFEGHIILGIEKAWVKSIANKYLNSRNTEWTNRS
jgi:hypothetical protein